MREHSPDNSNNTPENQHQKHFDLWQNHIHAFVEYDDTFLDEIRFVDGKLEGSLGGLIVGVKDVIDVAGLPTRNGSEACRNALPAITDAPVVKALRLAGASILGKTTTTEFAFTDPTNCRNPHDVNRTPGGSSSGSGAAVAAGLVDIALGTQTAGSLIRPAAYCGVVGFKPTYGALPTTGVTPLAPSFDTIGIIAGTVELAVRAFAVMCPSKGLVEIDQLSNVAVAMSQLQSDVVASIACMDAFQDASKAVEELQMINRSKGLLADVDFIVANHRKVMNFEASVLHKDLMSTECIGLLKPNFRKGLLAGAKMEKADYELSKHKLAEVKRAFWPQLADVDIILTLPVPDGAPSIDGTTGFQDWLTPWTVFGGPLLSLPWGRDELGRPRAVMLGAHPGEDMKLLVVAAALEKFAPLLPPPEPPSS